MASTSDIESQHVKDENLPLKKRFQAMLRTIRPPLTSECCIFRVPKELLRMNKESMYTPLVISIGPFHHNKDELKFMEKEKVRYLDHYIQQHNVSLDMLLTFVRDKEKSVRRSYGEHIELSSDDFVMMVLLDGLFVIEYLRWCCLGFEDQNDEMFYLPQLRISISMDLRLLENQLPFFVLESLYNFIFPIESRELPFLEISCQFFFYLNKQGITPQVKVLHFTDLIRTFHLHSSSGLQQPLQKNRVVEAVRIGLKSIVLYFTGLHQSTDHPKNNKIELEDISSYSAKELEESGIIFGVSSSKCLLDIQFTVNDGVFLIPQLTIYDQTESMFRNIMVLEQCLYMNEQCICDYVHLMDTLINTSKDVELLVQTGIISNTLGDHEKVAALFNDLNYGIVTGDSFSKLNQDLDKYCKKRWHKWRAGLIRDYFGSPWQIASVIAAILLLVLTLIQTVCSIMQVLPSKPKHP